ncbi:hypothetical protein KI387_006407 [Taxus chinensis]|uniref:non-specific serine/threonine protein kinase n=1 Tax=Taxus chinensis TaxID=29808 RepID=A0AA38GMN4_TAXCH|nr:hypothetical protein KI387_006407 [Taxus chinensis]
MWEVLKATDNFTNKVGEGEFRVVYRANLEGNLIGDVKRATKRGINNQQIFKEELSVLLRLNHPNLVNLIGLCFEKGEQILVFEFVPNGSLYGRLHKPSGHSSGPLSWASRMNIAFQIAVALQYLHEQAEPPVLHHDVKSANVLLVDDNHAKLTDFGLSKLGHRDNQAALAPLKGSYGYTDPQYIRTGKPTMKSDVYSFGVLLLEIITGLKAVQDFQTLAQWSEDYRLSQDMQVVMTLIDSTLNQEQTDLDELKMIIGIVNACLKERGEYRPSMREIVRALTQKVPIRALPVEDGDGDEKLNTIYYSAYSDSYMEKIVMQRMLLQLVQQQ